MPKYKDCKPCVYLSHVWNYCIKYDKNIKEVNTCKPTTIENLKDKPITKQEIQSMRENIKRRFGDF